jgi:hypothetical protein
VTKVSWRRVAVESPTLLEVRNDLMARATAQVRMVAASAVRLEDCAHYTEPGR